MEDTKLLVSGAASTPDKLAQAAQSSAATITQLAEVVKLGAASLGSNDPETQVWVGLGGRVSHPHVPINTVPQTAEEAQGEIGTSAVTSRCASMSVALGSARRHLSWQDGGTDCDGSHEGRDDW